MVDALITFSEGQNILASEANQNNQFLLSKLSDNAVQLTTYVKEQITSMQSNVASVQATLQANINNTNSKINNVESALNERIKNGVSIISGHKITAPGIVYFQAYTDTHNKTATGFINGLTVYLNDQTGGERNHHSIGLSVPVRVGDKVTYTGAVWEKVVFYAYE